jgi:hypothetical protein
MATIENATEIRPFRVEVPQQEIDELRRRMGARRWPEGETVADGSQGGGATAPAAVSVFLESSIRPREAGPSRPTPTSSTSTKSTKATTSPPGNSRNSSSAKCEPHSSHCARMEIVNE